MCRANIFTFKTFSFLLLVGPLAAQDYDANVEAYLEPYQSIEVSATENAAVKSIQVREGQFVSKGDVLARLDQVVLEKTLAVAVKEAASRGTLKTAEAEVELHKQKYGRIKDLIDSGHGRQHELNRAKADLQIAEGKLLRAKEELDIRQRELEQVQARLDARTVRSPIDGMVLEVKKDPGESVTPGDHVILVLVNLRQLKCVFHVSPQFAQQVHDKDSVTLRTHSKKKNLRNCRVEITSYRCRHGNGKSRRTRRQSKSSTCQWRILHFDSSQTQNR